MFNTTDLTLNYKKKLLIKQTYLITTWIYYLTKEFKNYKFSKKPKFFIQPKKTTKLTMIKAPMAHKTFSQEQFLYKYYIITFSIKLNSVYNININQFLYLFFLKKFEIFFKGSNLFFLKKILLTIKINDNNFFKLF